MKISVALCTYNGTKYLQEQLDSFAAQTRLPDELVVCDDASSDDTQLLLTSFAKTAPFDVRIFVNEKNLGSSKNFEQAIEKCTGDIIALSDQDDLWLPEKLESIASAFRSQLDAGLVFTNAIVTDEHLKSTGWKLWDMTFRRRDRKRFRKGEAVDVLLEYNVVTGATMAFRSHFRGQLLPIPELTDFIHDGWISLVIATRSRLHFIPEPLIKYRQHSSQQLGVGLSKRRRPIRERHDLYLENRVLALQRLPEIKDIFRERNLLSSRESAAEDLPITIDEFNRKIDERSEHIRKMIEHYRERAALPDARLMRLGPVLREICTLRYHRFSRGFVSVAADLIRK